MRPPKSMAQGSIPAKLTKDLEFCKYIIENILTNFEKHAFRKRQKAFCPQQHKLGFKEWNRERANLMESFLSLYKCNLRKDKVNFSQ